MDNRNTRWSLEATVDPNDKIRLRGFIRNEIAFYNALLAAFSSRMRTMPDIFSEVDHDLLCEVAAHGFKVGAFTPETLPSALNPYRTILFNSEGKIALSDRVLLMLDSVANAIVLHSEVRRHMAREILKAHVKQAAALQRQSSRLDQVLMAPVELLHPIEARTKRHVQLPRSAVVMDGSGRAIRTAYNGVPILLNPPLPKEFQWNILILRDDSGSDGAGWQAEFCNETVSYLVRKSDPPLNGKKRRRTASAR